MSFKLVVWEPSGSKINLGEEKKYYANIDKVSIKKI